MEVNPFRSFTLTRDNYNKSTNSDLEHALHIPFLGPPSPGRDSGNRLKGTLVIIIGSIIFLMLIVATLIINQSYDEPFEKQQINLIMPRGVAEGVSAKSNTFLSQQGSYNWTNAMLSWQRTAFHFQPERNWMNGKHN